MDIAYCVEQVWSPGLWSRTHQCTRKIKVTRDGDGYCKQHDPVEVELRRKARSAKWDAKAKKRQAKWDREAAEREACEGIDTEVLRSGVLGRLWHEHRTKEVTAESVQLASVVADGTQGMRRGE